MMCSWKIWRWGIILLRSIKALYWLLLLGSRGPPDRDEANGGNRDPLLKDTYDGLPNLRCICVTLFRWSHIYVVNPLNFFRLAFMRSWSSAPALLPSFTEILEEIPNINKKWVFVKLIFLVVLVIDVTASRFLQQAVLFSGVGSIRNLARTDPTKLSTGFGSQTYIHPVGGSAPVTFVSTVKVRECYLIDPKITNGKMQKVIEGAGIDGEWERLVCAVGQVINRQEYKSQVQAGYLQFSTTFITGTSASWGFCCLISQGCIESPSPSKGARRVSGPNLFTRGPNTSNVTLSCHDIGKFICFISAMYFYEGCSVQFPFMTVVKSTRAFMILCWTSTSSIASTANFHLTPGLWSHTLSIPGAQPHPSMCRSMLNG